MAVIAPVPAAATMPKSTRLAVVLTGIVMLLAAVAAAGGLFWQGLYRDSAYMVAQAVGQDLVTLFVAVPALAVTLFFVIRGSARATLAWLGLMAYMLYTYTTYAFGSAFNPFFLIYVALFSLCIVTMVAALTGIDAAAWRRRFDAGTPARPIAVFLLLVALMLIGLWLPPILRYLTTGVLPPELVKAAIPTNFVYVMDLGVVVPLAVTTGIWLWRRLPWGFILTGVVLAKAVTMGLALLAMLWFEVRAGQALEVAPLIVASIVTGGGLVLSAWFFRHCH